MSKLRQERPEKRVFAGREKVRVAAVQAAMSVFNKEKAVNKACAMIRKAAENGAQLVAFGECFITCFPGYYGPSSDANYDESIQWIRGWQDSSIVIPGDETDAIGRACQDAGVYCVMGCNELDERIGVHTYYNTQILFGPDGDILGKHRKIVPTYGERFYHGYGDGSTMQTYATDIGRIGMLICGEHREISASIPYMMQGEEIHIAAFPGQYDFPKPGTGGKFHIGGEVGYGSDLHFMNQEYAAKSGCFNIVVNDLLRAEDFEPEHKNLLDSRNLNIEWANGGSFILGPAGDYKAAPVFNDETILYSDLEAGEIKATKFFYDCMGHYSRPDITKVVFNTTKNEHLYPVSNAYQIPNVITEKARPETLTQMSEEFNVRLGLLEKMMANMENSLSAMADAKDKK